MCHVISYPCHTHSYVMESCKIFHCKNSVSIPSWQNSDHKENAIPPPPPTSVQILWCNVDKMFFYVHMIGKGEATWMNLQRAKFSRDHIGNRGIFSTYSHPKRKTEKNIHTHKHTLTNRESQNGDTNKPQQFNRKKRPKRAKLYVRILLQVPKFTSDFQNSNLCVLMNVRTTLCVST